jgi:hypothetical protein
MSIDDTGPNLEAPLPGSNAIGVFEIGVSPIGTIVPFDFWDTIISQYANSSVIDTLIGDFQQYVDQTTNFDAFYDNVWNIATANGVGLDILGRIIGVTRVLQIPGANTDFLGFEEALPGSEPFNQAPFFSGQQLTSNFALTDPAYRTLLYAKCLSNISDGSNKSINQILKALFPNRGNAYVGDNLNMTMAYTFRFALSPVELSIVEQSGVLPKPVGVSASIVQLTH